MAVVKTKQPTGLAIKRNKHVYTLTWKIGDKDYGDGQACIFRCNAEKWTNETVGVKTTSKAVAVDYTKYYPRTSVYLKKVYFGVRGNRKAYTEKGATIDPVMSAWSYKEFEFNAPQAPTISASLSSTYSNVCTFSWTAKNEVQSHTHFADCEYQSVLVKESIVTDGSKLSWKSGALGWQTGTSGATGSVTITEQTDLLADAAYTRWVRVRARGCRGASAWKYAKHVYARPFQAKIKTATVKQTNAGGYLCTVEWSADANAAHPIDKVTVQYALAVPMTGMVCPDGASWTDAIVVGDTTGADKAAFSIDTTVGDDQCLFVRVNTEHDTNITYGAAKAATTGYLADPTDLSASTNDQTYLATVTATNVSDVPDSYLLIRYTSATYPKGLAIGIIPHGQTSATVQCPTWASGEAIGFSVQAVVGAYVTSTGADSVTVYTVTEKMRSRNRLTYGGSVPVPPTSVSLAMTDTVGTVQVTFDWAWQDARAAELSWANHADAWQSTEEPDTYVIDNTNASVWNISGLEVGQTWYVRVRLVGGTEDNPTYGGYSDTVSIDLASEPITPVLTLSSGVITDGGTVTASWVYVSTDTTLQAYAEVAEYDGEDYTVIASTKTAQNITINASEVGWSTGEEHALAVRVVSASGRETGWSEPVSVMVAEPLLCEITQTSLVDETVIINPQEYSGDVVTFETETEPVVRELTVTLTPKQSGTGDPSPDNVRPISGYNAVDVVRTGKNLLNVNATGSASSGGMTYTVNDDKTVDVSGTRTGTSYRQIGTFRGVNGVTYKLTGVPDEIADNPGPARLYLARGSTTIYATHAGATFTYLDSMGDLGIVIRTDAQISGTIRFKPMVRLASISDPTYEPYQSDTYPITLPQSVYGGELDVVSGKLRVTHGYVVYDGSSDEDWTASGNNRMLASLSNSYAEGYTRIAVTANRGVFGTGSAVGTTFLSNRSLYYYQPTDITTASAFRSWLASNNLQVVYPLAAPIEITIDPQQITALLGQNVIWSDGGSVTVKIADDVQQLTALKEMPLTVTVTGAGTGGTTTVAIERLSAYHVTRPDEVDLYGFEGETVALMSQMGEAQMTINLADLIGRLDDGAPYRLTATVSDGLGQSSDASVDFWVAWDHQAIIPDGTVTIDTDHLAAMLVPVAPTGTVQGDVCDIYRLSVDRPQLIYADATFGQTYVDPYPTLGDYGGYRFVFKSKEGDYINADNEMAWTDVETEIEYGSNIIDFGTGRVELEYNVDVSNSWSKDFKETKYLGGSIQGDWNPAVSRTSSVGAVAIVARDLETIEAVRRLAVYPGLCHVRTKEGSSYPADVQVSESYAVSNGHKIADFSLKITRVDSEELDGMTLAEWNASHQEE